MDDRLATTGQVSPLINFTKQWHNQIVGPFMCHDGFLLESPCVMFTSEEISDKQEKTTSAVGHQCHVIHHLWCSDNISTSVSFFPWQNIVKYFVLCATGGPWWPYRNRIYVWDPHLHPPVCDVIHEVFTIQNVFRASLNHKHKKGNQGFIVRLTSWLTSISKLFLTPQNTEYRYRTLNHTFHSAHRPRKWKISPHTRA